ncbi:MAG TPA: carboxypeptidase-like regulatory domain-containing protein, partial [Terriglobales bacterium]|nr:carboxypeptidase-like regulatory domain-containing protein [Terriglobales bacterium]
MRRLLLALSVGLLFALTVNFAFGQAGETGSISGTVTDPSGAVVTGAKVEARNANTGALRSTVTNASGLYTFTNLLPGPYEVTVEASGFAKERATIQVSVGSRNEQDMKLQLAKAGTEVEVSAAAEAVQVNTSSQTLSDTVTARQISDLPTLTRNPYDLVGTSGNVTNTDPSGRGTGYSINGQRAASTDILLDGAENVDLFTAAVGQNVPLDSVQEFNVATNNFTA